MLSHATRNRNRVRSAYVRTELELERLRDDDPRPRRPDDPARRRDERPVTSVTPNRTGSVATTHADRADAA